MFQSSCAEKKKQITAPFLLRETAAAAATTRDNKQTNKQRPGEMAAARQQPVGTKVSELVKSYRWKPAGFMDPH